MAALRIIALLLVWLLTAAFMPFTIGGIFTSRVPPGTLVTHTVGSNANGTTSAGVGTLTFSAMSIGAADAARLVAVIVSTVQSSTPTPTSVTIGGNVATLRVSLLSGTKFIGIYTYPLTTGTTADVVVNVSVGGLNFAGFAQTYALYNTASAVPTATATSTATPLAGSLAVTDGDFVLAAADSTGSDSSASWAVLHADTFVSWGVHRAASASLRVIADGLVNATCTYSSPSAPIAVFASWSP